jgi:hypothetical protein
MACGGWKLRLSSDDRRERYYSWLCLLRYTGRPIGDKMRKSKFWVVIWITAFGVEVAPEDGLEAQESLASTGG